MKQSSGADHYIACVCPLCLQMAYEELRSAQAGRESLQFPHAPSAAAFHGLVLAGVASYVDRHATSKGRVLQYAGVSLRLTGYDIRAGLKAHPNCPQVLLQFFDTEI